MRTASSTAGSPSAVQVDRRCPTVTPAVHRGAGSGPPGTHDAGREARAARRRCGRSRSSTARGSTRAGAGAAGPGHRAGHARRRRHQPAARAGGRVRGNQIQRFLVEETRLGIPAIIHEESLHGVHGRAARPASRSRSGRRPPGTSSSSRRWPASSADRLRAMGASQALAPVLDISRDPRWGRLEETYGEDPYLVADARLCLRARHPGDARRRPARHRHRQAHGRPRRPGGRPQHGPGAHRPARAARRLPAALRGGRARGRASARSCTPTTSWTACRARRPGSC